MGGEVEVDVDIPEPVILVCGKLGGEEGEVPERLPIRGEGTGGASEAEV